MSTEQKEYDSGNGSACVAVLASARVRDMINLSFIIFYYGSVRVSVSLLVNMVS